MQKARRPPESGASIENCTRTAARSGMGKGSTIVNDYIVEHPRTRATAQARSRKPVPGKIVVSKTA